MTATLQLNLGETLTEQELAEITAEATEQGKSLSRLLFEGAQEVVRKRREASQKPAPGNGPGKSPAMAA